MLNKLLAATKMRVLNNRNITITMRREDKARRRALMKAKARNKYYWRALSILGDAKRRQYLKSAEYKKDATNFEEFFMVRKFGKRHFSRNSLCHI